MTTQSDLLEALEAARDLYLREFSRVIKTLPPDDMIVEPALMDETGEPLREGFWNSGYRVDLARASTGETLRVDSRQQLSFGPLGLSTGPASVTV